MPVIMETNLLKMWIGINISRFIYCIITRLIGSMGMKALHDLKQRKGANGRQQIFSSLKCKQEFQSCN